MTYDRYRELLEHLTGLVESLEDSDKALEKSQEFVDDLAGYLRMSWNVSQSQRDSAEAETSRQYYLGRAHAIEGIATRTRIKLTVPEEEQ